jgi:hypothetical protein
MAQPLHFNITITASPLHVWTTMLDDAHYRIWTEVWQSGSSFIGDWSEGSEISFVDPSGAGIHGQVAINLPGEYVETHLKYELAPGQVPRIETASIWEGAKECYRYTAQGDGCLLEITLEAPHMPDAMADYMASTWPQALAVVKTICEKAA